MEMNEIKEEVIKQIARKFNKKEMQIYIMFKEVYKLGITDIKFNKYIDEFYKMLDNESKL